MERKRVLILIGAAVIVLALLACDADTFTAFLNSATATPTRTPRPTFTPRPTSSPTPEDTPTPEATPTTAASLTPTKRAVATSRPATKPPAPPPPPQFEWKRSPSGNQGKCDAGPGTWEIKGRIHDGMAYVGGIHVVLLDKDGKVVTQGDSRYPEELNPEWGVSCFEEKNLFNYQLDASAGRASGPLVVRLTRGANDLTPISPDAQITFDASGGRWYIDWTK